jgi:hypothetical protein
MFVQCKAEDAGNVFKVKRSRCRIFIKATGDTFSGDEILKMKHDRRRREFINGKKVDSFTTSNSSLLRRRPTMTSK